MPRSAPAFELLCQIAERNGLTVEIMGRPGHTAIWVMPLADEAREARLGQVEGVEVTASVRCGVVATPFWDVPFNDAAPQLIRMLAEKGYV